MKNMMKKITIAALSASMIIGSCSVVALADEAAGNDVTQSEANEVMLIGAGQDAEEDTLLISANPETEEETDGVTESTFDYTIKKYKKTYKTASGLTYKTVSYKYPVITASNKTAQKNINAYYAKLKKAWISNSKKNLKIAKQEATKKMYYSDEMTCKVTYLDKSYVSIVQDGYDYTMGAHGMPYREAHVFNVNTGKEVTAADLLGVSTKSEVNTIVRNLYVKKFKKNLKTGENFFYGETVKQVKKDLATVGFNNRYYLDGDGNVIFYAEPYLIGPYASGYITVTTKVGLSGTYVDTEGTSSKYSTIKIGTLANGSYPVTISIYRLATVKGTAVMQDGVLKFTGKVNGSAVSGDIEVNGNVADFTVTESAWENLAVGDSVHCPCRW